MNWTEEALKYCPHRLAGNPPFVAWMAERLDDGLLVDCGANVGAVCVATLLSAKPGARAVAFEPQTRLLDVAMGLIVANRVDVEWHTAAVGGKAGEAVLTYPVDQDISGWGTLADNPDFTEAKGNKRTAFLTQPCKVVTLDGWWAEAGKPDVQVVKVDCQGAEVDILEGGWQMFQTVDYLFIEKHGPTLKEHGRSIQDLLNALDGLGYDYEPANRNNLRCWKRKAE